MLVSFRGFEAVHVSADRAQGVDAGGLGRLGFAWVDVSRKRKRTGWYVALAVETFRHESMLLEARPQGAHSPREILREPGPVAPVVGWQRSIRPKSCQNPGLR